MAKVKETICFLRWLSLVEVFMLKEARLRLKLELEQMEISEIGVVQGGTEFFCYLMCSSIFIEKMCA